MSDPAVLIVEDDPHLRDALFDTLKEAAVPVLTAASGPQALEIIEREDIGLLVSDLHMDPMDGATLLKKVQDRYPSIPAVLMTAYGTIESAVDVIRNGACDYLVKPFDAQQLKKVVERYLSTDKETSGFVAVDPKTRALLKIAQRVAKTDATVTISGESGCGKEIFAHYIHDLSPRSEQPFIAINCAAIPENMLEAVLFGYEKGAFTGATSAHAGKFEQADSGTLLLDEISEMDLPLQAKLLRVIQEREVERIGGRKTIRLDVRVLATTNRELRQFVADGKFREDLFYRLNVFPLHIPPLRDRPLDIVPLAELFLRKNAQTSVHKLHAAASKKLLTHAWPGNVRELDNVIQRTVILQQGETIKESDLAFEDNWLPAEQSKSDSGLHEGLKSREFQLIVDALSETHGHRAAAASALGISPRTLRYKLARIRESGIAIPGDRHE